ncbi:oligosaccharide flippase family protein [Arthrobacter gyeryongensis]|uniref:oligosaccharide flippase family protein n=1 Tax=Arthrobacter gyeryongensis TaxID=1650592 RepID=UPI0031EBFF9B
MSTFALAARGVQWMLVAQVLTSLGQFLYAALTARAFPPEVFGTFAAALSLQGLITLMTTTGLPSFALKQQSLSKSFARQIRWWALAGGAVSSLVFLAVSAPWLHLLRASGGSVFVPILAVAQGLAPIAAVESAIMRREGRSRLDATSLLGAFITANGTAAVVIGLRGEAWSLGLATAIYPVALFVLCRLLNKAQLPVEKKVSIRELLSFSRKITLQNVVFLVLQQLPSWLISSRAGTESLGHFSRASTLAGMPATAMSTSINRALQPHWRKLNEGSSGDRAMVDSAILASALAFPLFGLLVAHAPAIILLWLGPNWSKSANLVPLLAVSYGLSIPFTVVANSAEMRGLFKPVRFAQIAMAVGLAPGLVVLYFSGEPIWACAAMALSQFCGIATLIIRLPWYSRRAMKSTILGISEQIGWALIICGLGWAAAEIARSNHLTLFANSAATHLTLGFLISAGVWLVTFRFNRARRILKNRLPSRSPIKAMT